MAGHALDLGSSAVNVAERLFWCDAHGLCEIASLIDDDGELTEDEDFAVIAVIRVRDDCWLNVDLRDYQRQRAN